VLVDRVDLVLFALLLVEVDRRRFDLFAVGVALRAVEDEDLELFEPAVDGVDFRREPDDLVGSTS